VCTTDAVVGPSTVYQVSMCPVVAEYTTRANVSPEQVGQANDKYRAPREDVNRWQQERLRVHEAQLEATTKQLDAHEVNERRYLQRVSPRRGRERGLSATQQRVDDPRDPLTVSGLNAPPGADLNQYGLTVPPPSALGNPKVLEPADIGRGSPWKLLKDGRVPLGGIVDPTTFQEPRWPMTQLSEPDAIAAGRDTAIALAQSLGPVKAANKSPRKYRFGGEIDMQSIGNDQHRLVKSWRSPKPTAPASA